MNRISAQIVNIMLLVVMLVGGTMILCETRGLQLYWVVRGGIG
jgi:hypothetical protein